MTRSQFRRAMAAVTMGLSGFNFVMVIVLLAACSAPVVKDRPVRVAVPVAQPCARARPAPVVPLKDQAIDWSALDVKQKSARVGKQGLDHKTYGEQLSAATAACP